MFWGLILRGPPVPYIKGTFLEPPRPVEIVRSFHISKAILFNPRDYYADGAYGFVRVMVNSPRHSIEICRMYNNRSGLTQADLNLTFSKRDFVAFFTSLHCAAEQDNVYGAHYAPEIHLSGFYLEAQTEDNARGSLSATSNVSASSHVSGVSQHGVRYAVAERVLQNQPASVALKTVPVKQLGPNPETTPTFEQPGKSNATHQQPETSKPTPEQPEKSRE